MTTKQLFEALAPEIVTNFLKTRTSKAIPEKVQTFILNMDKVPELHRQYPSVNRCTRELLSRYPNDFSSFRYAQEVVFASIQYMHLNNSVANAAWDNYFADKQEELAQIATGLGQIDKASLCLERARTYRTNKDDNAIDASKLHPHWFVVSPEAPASLFNFDVNGKEPTLNEVFKRKESIYTDTEAFIDKMEITPEEKERLKNEARLNLNIPEDIDHEEIE